MPAAGRLTITGACEGGNQLTCAGVPSVSQGRACGRDLRGAGRGLCPERDRALGGAQRVVGRAAGAPVGDRADRAVEADVHLRAGRGRSSRLRHAAQPGRAASDARCAALPSAQPSQPGRRTFTSTETCSPGSAASAASGARHRTAIGTRRPSGPNAWTCSIVPPNGCTVTRASAVESLASVDAREGDHRHGQQHEDHGDHRATPSRTRLRPIARYSKSG